MRNTENKSKNDSPESIKAATQMFRYIKRVYHDNRKSPPNKVFSTIESALPPAKESNISQAVKSFLSNANKEIVSQRCDVTADMPLGFPDWVLSVAENSSPSEHKHQDKIELLRRGICNELAKGMIANLDSKQYLSNIDGLGLLSKVRESTEIHELSLHQKFKAVFECLCYQPKNKEGWIVLSECCCFKSEYIRDRLVPTQGSYKALDFYLTPESKRQTPMTMTLEQLQNIQYEEFQALRRSWIPFIGKNLYPYMKYAWANFASLQACANEIGSTISPIDSSSKGSNNDGQNSDFESWNNIESKFREGNYVQWANSWAGLFLLALRTMRERSLSVARYLATKNVQQGIAMHPSEVSEDIGTVLYSDLISSTVYGYPMHPMTMYEKRIIAKRSLSALQEAIQLSNSNGYTQKCDTIIWEIQFMKGKCIEKIASTLREEVYSTKGS